MVLKAKLFRHIGGSPNKNDVDKGQSCQRTDYGAHGEPIAGVVDMLCDATADEAECHDQDSDDAEDPVDDEGIVHHDEYAVSADGASLLKKQRCADDASFGMKGRGVHISRIDLRRHVRTGCPL